MTGDGNPLDLLQDYHPSNKCLAEKEAAKAESIRLKQQAQEKADVAKYMFF